MPDRVVIFGRLRVVGIVPIHEVAESFGLLGYTCSEAIDSLAAFFDEFAYAERFDVALRLEAHLFFDFDFDPKTLSVESVLETLFIALHVAEPEEEVFVRSTPSVVNTHGVVGGDRTVDEREFLLFIVVQRSVAGGNVVVFPPFKDFFLFGYEVDFWIYRIEVARHVYFPIAVPELGARFLTEFSLTS